MWDTFDQEDAKLEKFLDKLSLDAHSIVKNNSVNDYDEAEMVNEEEE